MVDKVLVIGSGLYGSVFARICKDAGLDVLVVEKRKHIGGNCYDVYDEETGITIQLYGAHIFHTNNEDVWNFMNKYTKFNNFINEVKACNNGKYYSLPFNLNTFKEIYGCETAEEAKKILDEKTEKYKNITPTNLKEQALKFVGKDIYNLLIRDYTEKQWKKHCKDLSPDIIKRIPIRFEYNNNYFNDKYQGIPKKGYHTLFDNLLKGIKVIKGCNIKQQALKNFKGLIVYTGKIDEFFDYCYGKLDYRTCDFDILTLNKEYFQDRAVVNYTDKSHPYTRIIEHKYFLNEKSEKTVITIETPVKYTDNKLPLYPMNDEKNNILYNKYKEKASQMSNLIISGRLGSYAYYDMNKVVELAMKEANEFLERNKE